MFKSEVVVVNIGFDTAGAIGISVVPAVKAVLAVIIVTLVNGWIGGVFDGVFNGLVVVNIRTGSVIKIVENVDETVVANNNVGSV